MNTATAPARAASVCCGSVRLRSHALRGVWGVCARRGSAHQRIEQGPARPSHLGHHIRDAAAHPRAWRPDAARANVAGVAASGAESAGGVWTRPAWLVGASPGGSLER